MRKIAAVAMLAMLAMLAACAKSPNQIKAVPNAGPCTKADRDKLAELSSRQESTANADALGVLLIGVPTGSLAGNDHEAEIAILKGRCG